MPIAADLPDDIEELKQLVVARTVERDAFKVERDAAVAERDAAKAGLIAKTLEAEKLKFELARLKRMTFGASSERIKREIEQLELKLEELESDEAQGEPAATPEPSPDEQPAEAREKKRRRQLPEHLPRTTETHEPASPTCASLRQRSAAQGGRGCDRDPRVHSRPLRGRASRAACLLVPHVRGHDAGADAVAADPARAGGPRSAGAHCHRQVLRSRSALSPGRDLCPRRRRSRPRHAGRLDRQDRLAGASRSPTGLASTSWRAA